MKRFLSCVLLSTLCACGGCEQDPEQLSEDAQAWIGEGKSVDTDLFEVPIPDRVYQQAYAKAQEEINKDNVKDRLRELERAIQSELSP